MADEPVGYAQDEQGWYVFTAGAVGRLLGRFGTEGEAIAFAEAHMGRSFDFEDGTGVQV